MSKIEWRKDWKPSELEAQRYWFTPRHCLDGRLVIGDVIRNVPLSDGSVVSVAFIEGRGYQDNQLVPYDLGPPCRIDDAAEVERLRVIFKQIAAQYSIKIKADDAYYEIADLVERALYPERFAERQEAGYSCPKCAEHVPPNHYHFCDTERQEVGDGE